MSQPSSLANLFRASGLYAFGNALNRVGGFLLLPLYTRYLSVAEYGTLEFLYAISSIAAGILSIGIASATLRFYFDYDDPKDQHAVISTNFWASLLIGGIGGLTLWFGISAFGDKLLPSTTPAAALGLVLATICFELSTEVCLAYIRAREMPILFVSISLAKLITQCSANIYLVRVQGAGIEGVLLGNLIAVGLEWCLLAGFCLHSCGVAFSLRKLIPVLRYCAPFLFTTVLGIVASNFDRFLINSVLSVEALGIYALALKFSRLIAEFIGTPFGLAFGAYRFAIMKQANAGDIQARVVRYLACVLAIFGLALSYFLIDILRVMTDPHYWPAADLMPWLVTASVLSVLTGPLQTGILYAKRTSELFYITLVGACVGLPLAWWAAHAHGLVGVCAAVVVTSALKAALTVKLSAKHLSVSYGVSPWLAMTVLWVAFQLLPMTTQALPPLAAAAGKGGLLLAFTASLFLCRILTFAELKEALNAIRSSRRVR